LLGARLGDVRAPQLVGDEQQQEGAERDERATHGEKDAAGTHAEIQGRPCALRLRGARLTPRRRLTPLTEDVLPRRAGNSRRVAAPRRAASSATSSGVYGASSPSSVVVSDLRALNRTVEPVACVAPRCGAGGGAPGPGATGLIAGGAGGPGGPGDAGGADGAL